MTCNVDVGRRMEFGFEEKREQMRKRDKRIEIMRERREKYQGKGEFFFFLQSQMLSTLGLEMPNSS